MKQLPLKISMCKECPYFVPRLNVTPILAYLAYCNYTIANTGNKVLINNAYQIDSQCMLEDVVEEL